MHSCVILWDQRPFSGGITSLQWKVITWHVVFDYYPSPTLANFCPLPRLCVQMDFTRTFQTNTMCNNYLILKWKQSQNGQPPTFSSGMAEPGRGGSTEGRADHAYQITTCPLPLPILKPATCPVTKKFHPYSIFIKVNKGGIRRL